MVSTTNGFHNHDLRATLPSDTGDIKTQVSRCLARLHAKPTPLDKYEYLHALRISNPALFYRMLIDNMPLLAPIVYTPTIGAVCQKFSHIYASNTRALFLNWTDRGHIQEILDQAPFENIKIAVATDGSRILGIGDQGLDGLGISVGKLTLYCSCAGISPESTLPIVFDMGTNNQDKINDPFYLGLRMPRVSQQDEEAFIEEFMIAAKKRWPGMVVQFEDFATDLAFGLLEKFRYDFTCFNDDVQGTAAVTLAGLISAFGRTSVSPITANRIVFFGAGSAGVGIAKLICEYFQHEGLDEESAKNMITLVDSKGLVADNRGDKLAEHKKYFSKHDPNTPRLSSLLDVIQHYKPTALLGLSTVFGAFDETIVREMAKMNERPIIFALSNPTSKSECSFENAVTWTEDRVLFAAGSPYQPIEYKGKLHYADQGNNIYVFPAIGKAAILAKVDTIPESMIHAAARALPKTVTKEEREEKGLLYPELNRIREVTVFITREVIRAAQKAKVDKAVELRTMDDAQLDDFVRSQMYEPQPIVKRSAIRSSL